MRDLFADGGLERIDIPDADIYYSPRADLGADPDVLLKQLIEQIAWRTEVINLWGKEYPQPRLVAWF